MRFGGGGGGAYFREGVFVGGGSLLWEFNGSLLLAASGFLMTMKT